MRLNLQRALRGRDIDIGLLYIDRQPECMVEMLGAFAIVSGHYRIDIRLVPRFGRPLPVLFDAAGIERLQVVPADALSEWVPGCLVPAQEMPGGGIRRSRQAFDSVYAQIQAALALGERVRIRIA